MSEQEKSAAQQRIDNAVYGTPKIKPDEQRKYLGTFRERVCLTISVQELQEQDWTKALTAELDRGIGNLVFINGNLPHDEIPAGPQIQLAAYAGINPFLSPLGDGQPRLLCGTALLRSPSG